MSRPTFVSLFTGVGGLDLGLERAGWRCVAQVEVDPFCQRVLERHWPRVPRWGDIKELDPDELPRADLLCAGFPCQPVSVAGKGLAQADERWLWPEVARLVRHLRPRWLLLENVPGLLARGMGDVLGDLASCGYDAEWDCVSAADVGAPHLRRRVWIVAYPAGARRSAGPSGAGRPFWDDAWREGSRGLGGDAADPERVELWDQPGRRDGQDRPGPVVAGDDGTPQPVADSNCSPGGRAARLAIARVGRGTLPAGPPEPRRRRGYLADTDGASKDAQPSPGGPWPPARQRGWWDVEPDVGRVAHGVPARLDRLRALGNAVVPQVAEHVGRLILEAHLFRVTATPGATSHRVDASPSPHAAGGAPGTGEVAVALDPTFEGETPGAVAAPSPSDPTSETEAPGTATTGALLIGRDFASVSDATSPGKVAVPATAAGLDWGLGTSPGGSTSRWSLVIRRRAGCQPRTDVEVKEGIL